MKNLNKKRVLGAASFLYLILFVSILFFNKASIANNVACLLVLPAIPFGMKFASTFTDHIFK